MNIVSIISDEIGYDKNRNQLLDIKGIRDEIMIDDQNDARFCISVILNGIIKEDIRVLIRLENPKLGNYLNIGEKDIENPDSRNVSTIDYKLIFDADIRFPEVGTYILRSIVMPLVDVEQEDEDKINLLAQNIISLEVKR